MKNTTRTSILKRADFFWQIGTHTWATALIVQFSMKSNPIKFGGLCLVLKGTLWEAHLGVRLLQIACKHWNSSKPPNSIHLQKVTDTILLFNVFCAFFIQAYALRDHLKSDQKTKVGPNYWNPTSNKSIRSLVIRSKNKKETKWTSSLFKYQKLRSQKAYTLRLEASIYGK